MRVPRVAAYRGLIFASLSGEGESLEGWLGGAREYVDLWADLSRRACVWAEAYYQKKKADGMNHTAALRCLGQRWVKILWKMWQTGTPYNEALHLKNQTRHGSWLIQLLPATPAKT